MSELGLGCVWQGGQGMRIMTVAFAVGTALVLCNLGTFSIAAHAQKAKVVRQPRERPIIRVPVVTTTPYWDYYIVPRYRYRPEDDRVDPCGGPVVPVIRYGPQEETVPLWLGGTVRSGPCKGRRQYGSDWPENFPLFPQADSCAFVSTTLETKRAAKRPSQGSGRPKCKREWVAEGRFGSFSEVS